MKGFSHESPRNESVEWYTPPEVFEALGVEFDLDPCSPGSGKSFVPARRHLTIEDDGLASEWDGFVFMNPPYGNETKKWMEKLSKHDNGIALVFSRTDVKWFQEYVAGKASLVCFVDGRIKFFQGNTEDRGGTPGAGSILVAYGEQAAYVVWKSNLGACVRFTPRHDDRNASGA